MIHNTIKTLAILSLVAVVLFVATGFSRTEPATLDSIAQAESKVESDRFDKTVRLYELSRSADGPNIRPMEYSAYNDQLLHMGEGDELYLLFRVDDTVQVFEIRCDAYKAVTIKPMEYLHRGLDKSKIIQLEYQATIIVD